MRLHRSRLLAGCLGLVVAATLSACGGSGSNGDAGTAAGPPVAVDAPKWAEIEKAANGEGQLTAYVSLTGMEPVFEDFKRDYPGIAVTIEQVPTADLLPRLDQELSVRAPGADFTFHASPGWFADNFKKNNFRSLEIGPEAQGAGAVQRVGANNYTPVYGFPNVISYRTSVPKPENIDQLLKSNPNARIGLVDPRRSSPAVSYQYSILQQAFGEDIMSRLAKAKVTVVPSNPQLTEGIASGDFDYAYPDIASITNAVIKKGAPVGIVVPQGDSVAGVQYNVAIPTTAPHPNAAEVLTNWMMGPRGATSFAAHLQPAVTPVPVQGSLAQDSVKTFDVTQWTTDAQQAWIGKYFAPNFG